MTDFAKFSRLFNYEIQNRLFALNALTSFVANESDLEKREFWKAYLSLEKLNQLKYRPMIEKYGFDPKPGRTTRFKTNLMVMVNRWYPRYTEKKMYQAMVKYVTKLEQLMSLAEGDEFAFFEYMVAQEQAQVEAMELIIEGRTIQATNLLKDFVKENSTQ